MTGPGSLRWSRPRRDTTASLMTVNFLSCPESFLVAETLEFVRKNAEEIESISYVYCVDECGSLTGVASLRDLLPGRSGQSALRGHEPKARHPQWRRRLGRNRQSVSQVPFQSDPGGGCGVPSRGNRHVQAFLRRTVELLLQTCELDPS